ncbi:unnamed protein product [Effrenium voratum]|uniref:Glycosyl transferase family 25 domain-containing protein n=1 Tax=Effrenium voratum TaxID=2562239 RepID=A0AA36MVC4_9DINO|nr:unnamed protein product [Effrenium voratum]
MRSRAFCLSLQQRPARFGAAEAAMAQLPESLQLEMFPGIYGNDFRHLLPDLSALEAAMGCRLYHQWPICDVEDVVRMKPELAELPDWKAWETYISWHRCWISDRASNYIDFYNRHLKLGEVAACLGHFRLWQKAVEEDLELCVVFEDDARPSRSGLEKFLSELAKLDAMEFQWDLIYLHSALYSKAQEPEVPGCELLLAGHRKWAGAYALSSRGLKKLVASGYDQCIFPVDDFLPALHSFHPRPDIRDLPCVRAVDGFVALTVPDTQKLVEVEDRGSVSKFSTVLLGDLGATMGDSEDECEAQPLEAFEDFSFQSDAAAAAAMLAQHGFVLLRLPDSFAEAEEAWQEFFAGSRKSCFRGLRSGAGLAAELPLADVGYTRQTAREHFHVILGASDQQEWPPKLQQKTQPLVDALEQLCRQLLRALPNGPVMDEAWERETMRTKDASVFDAFSYFPRTGNQSGPGTIHAK